MSIELNQSQLEFINLNSKGIAEALLNSDRYIKVIELVDIKNNKVTTFLHRINGTILKEKRLSNIEIYDKYYEYLNKEQIKNLLINE